MPSGEVEAAAAAAGEKEFLFFLVFGDLVDPSGCLSPCGSSLFFCLSFRFSRLSVALLLSPPVSNFML